MTEVPPQITAEELVLSMESHFVSAEQIEDAGTITASEILHCMDTMRTILVLTTVVDVQLLPEDERAILEDIRISATHAQLAARRLLKHRAPTCVQRAMEEYLETVETTRYMLTMIDQRLAGMFSTLLTRDQCPAPTT